MHRFSADEYLFVLDLLDQTNFHEAKSTGIGETLHESIFMNKNAAVDYKVGCLFVLNAV